MQAQLEQNLPVIVSVGPNFPLFWQKHRLPLCQKAADGVYICTDFAVSHFFTVIGMDDLWMRVVSWGRLYEISREAYSDFVNKHSCWLFSNLIELQKKEHRR